MSQELATETTVNPGWRALPAAGVFQRPIREPEERWLPSCDGSKLLCRVWTGQSGRPCIVYLHGIEGHGGWIEQTASWLNELGFSVYAPDRRGAGRHRVDRGELISWRRLLQDLNDVLALAGAEQPGGRLYLMANCWGAKVALACINGGCDLNFLTDRQLDGLILTCPAVAVKVDLSLATKLQVGVAWLKGSLRQFALPLTPEMFTENQPYLEYVRTDPLRLTHVTASFLIESLKLSRAARESARHLKIPLLVLQAGGDRIVDVDLLRKWFDRVQASDKRLHIFPDAAHSLDFDPCAPEYLKVLGDWLQSLARE